ncbi:hypothetical protein [Leptospira interrogans]|nr:hypothetical protein [Leptospira interrogans]
MRVIFYSWQLSPKFELEIMTGQGDPAKYPDELQGYGVRILRIQNNLPKIQKDTARLMQSNQLRKQISFPIHKEEPINRIS